MIAIVRALLECGFYPGFSKPTFSLVARWGILCLPWSIPSIMIERYLSRFKPWPLCHAYSTSDPLPCKNISGLRVRYWCSSKCYFLFFSLLCEVNSPHEWQLYVIFISCLRWSKPVLNVNTHCTLAESAHRQQSQFRRICVASAVLPVNPMWGLWVWRNVLLEKLITSNSIICNVWCCTIRGNLWK